MTTNGSLNAAKRAKKDEFYTLFRDIESEAFAYTDYDPDTFRGKTILLPADDPEESNFTKFFALNFEHLGLRRLISTSYNPGGRGKKFVLDRDVQGDGRIDIDDLEATDLTGDGDFRSEEVTALRDEADIIITNPPFSLFREFLAWIMEADKKFLLLGNMTSVTAKNVWPFIQNGQMWYGPSISSGDRAFYVPDDYPLEAAGCGVDADGNRYIRVKGVRWFTNLDHGRRHEPLPLASAANVLRYHRALAGKSAYDRLDNYNAIYVPKTLSIPADYADVMAVPISFLDKYCPEQFEIVGITESRIDSPVASLRVPGSEKYDRPYIGGKRKFPLIFIRHRKPASNSAA